MEAPRRASSQGAGRPIPEAPTVLWTILAILLVLWLLGLIGGIGGAAIHLLLVLAIVVFVAQLLTSRGSSSV
jgi:hypothetical protein